MDPAPTKMEVTETQRTEMKIGMMVLLNALMTRLQLPWLGDGSCGREVGKEGVVGPAATCARACACEVELAESSGRWAKGVLCRPPPRRRSAAAGPVASRPGRSADDWPRETGGDESRLGPACLAAARRW
jgi:hypothetical protein